MTEQQPLKKFAKFPGQYVDSTSPNFLDFSDSREVNVFYEATKGLEPKHDLAPYTGTSPLFYYYVHHHVVMYNWNSLVNIIPARELKSATRTFSGKVHMVYDAKSVALADVQAYARSYLSKNERLSQQSGMLYMFLRNSLSQHINQIIARDYIDQYCIDGHLDGVCFLWTIIKNFPPLW
jgi:hypothetical protein